MLTCALATGLYADSIRLGCERFDLLLNTNGSVAAVLPANEGDGPKPGPSAGKPASSLFTLELQESVYGLEDGARRLVSLDALSPDGDRLILTSRAESSARLTVEVASKGDYLTLRLVRVETPDGEHATRMDLVNVPGLRTFPLNAEVMRDSARGVVFQGLLQRSPATNLGGVALWYPQTDELDDEILYRVWVDEGLPHPKVDGEWTVGRAKRWVADYIETFRNYSEIYITGESLDELKRCVDDGARMKMANVYMHLMTWAGRYWPEGQDVYQLNEQLFPNGLADFRELRDYARSKGLGIGIRTLSNSISLKSEEYIAPRPDRRLAHFWRGTLVEEIGPQSESLRIRTDRTLPTSFAAKGFGTKTNAPSIKFLLIDDEILQYAGHEEHEDGSITLQVARGRGRQLLRGYGPTEAAGHSPGALVKILTGHFRDHVAPDHDSELLDVVAQRYADFSNEMDLVTSSFDGLYLYTFQTPYGATKLPGAVYSKLDHPTVCTTSNGPPKWGYFEIHFNSIRRALGMDVGSLGGGMEVPQRMRLMVGLHQDHWPAPSPYGHTYAVVPNATAGNFWCSIQDQSSTHEFTPAVFEGFGLLDHFATAIQRWRQFGPGLPDPVKKRIWSAYEDGAIRYPTQVEHFRFEENGDDLDVVPFRPMRRTVGDRGWGYIQEHGPVYTYQYIRPNAQGLIQAENPYHAQVPEVILRVMPDFHREEQAQAGAVNHSLMIPAEDPDSGRKPKVDPGRMTLTVQPDGARITYDNRSRNEFVFEDDRKTTSLISYNVSSSIENAKGLGITITGDGSNAMFVVRIRGGGTRDYVVPIDFVGRRTIEIPDPQVSWSDARWPITSDWKRWRGHAVKKVLVGFGSVPPNIKASVVVEDIRLLPEKESALSNPVIHCGDGTISIAGTIPSGRYIWYKDGGKAEVFDLNWNKFEELRVAASDAEVPSGRSDIRVENHNPAGDPWVECQFFVRDRPIHTVTIAENPPTERLLP